MNKLASPFDWNRASAKPAAPAFASAGNQYFAFLSYSHNDSVVADWLHGQLERFRVPASLAGRLTATGVVPRRLTPIFRDRHELAASQDLGTEIREALQASHCLIVLCSPAAAASKWTNAEIELFRRLHPDGCVIAAIISGEPFASEVKGKEAEECLPPALRRKYDRRGRPTAKRAEPLAADLRDVGDGRRLGFLKIVAGMLGVGLDELVQRDQVRRQRRLATITGASFLGMIAALLLAVTAIEARDAARDQRREAESLIGFMLGDLKDKLQPIGRLDVLDSVGARALAYFGKQDMSELSDEALAQRSKALTLLGQVTTDRGDLDRATRFYREAFEGTAEALRRNPNEPQRIFDHAQNVFYVGDVARMRGDLARAEAAMREYKLLAERLIAFDPANPTWQMEMIYADTNLGVILNETGRYSEAAAVFENALSERERLLAANPTNDEYRRSLIEVMAWLAEAREKEGRLDDGLAMRERQIGLLEPLIGSEKTHAAYKRQALVAYRAAGRVNRIRGNKEEGLAQLRAGIAIGEQLMALEPSNSEWAQFTAWIKLEFARSSLAQNDFNTASAMTQAGCDIANRLIARDPTVVDWRLLLRGECFELKARIALARGDVAAASVQASEMLRIARAEISKARSHDSELALANAYIFTGLAARASGDQAAALAAFRNAARSWPRTLPDRPSLLAKKVVIYRGLNDDRQANELASKLAGIGYGDELYLRDARLAG